MSFYREPQATRLLRLRRGIASIRSVIRTIRPISGTFRRGLAAAAAPFQLKDPYSMQAACCQLPVFRIENFDYGSEIKSRHFHFAPLQNLMSTLPYPHRHDFFHIVWVDRGTGRHVIDSETYEVRPRTLFFMSPGQIHDFELSPDAEGYTISFSAEFFALQLQNKNLLTEIPVYNLESSIQALYPQEADAAEILQVLDAIRHEYHSDEFGAQDMIRSYLFILLVKASRLVTPSRGADAARQGQNVYRHFKHALEEHFSTRQEVGHYASMLRVTERFLNDAVRRATGRTAAQMIRDRVILEAKRLLAHSGVAVGDVGSQLGFEDPAYFSRCFKKHTGRTPLEFRQSVGRLAA